VIGLRRNSICKRASAMPRTCCRFSRRQDQLLQRLPALTRRRHAPRLNPLDALPSPGSRLPQRPRLQLQCPARRRRAAHQGGTRPQRHRRRAKSTPADPPHLLYLVDPGRQVRYQGPAQLQLRRQPPTGQARPGDRRCAAARPAGKMHPPHPRGWAEVEALQDRQSSARAARVPSAMPVACSTYSSKHLTDAYGTEADRLQMSCPRQTR